MTSLLTLPNELLQHIAFFLPFSTIIRLQRVNRRLYETYNDRLVLQSAARTGFYNTTGAVERWLHMHSAPNQMATETAQLVWHEGDLLLHYASKQEVKKIAYAVEQCTKGTMAEHDGWTLRRSPDKTSRALSDWLPQLLALHHPAALALKPDAFLRVHGEISRTFNNGTGVDLLIRGQFSRSASSTTFAEQLADLTNVNFILSFTTLQHLAATLDSKHTLQLFAEFFCPTQMEAGQPNSQRNESSDIKNTMKHLCERVPEYGEHRSAFNLAQASSVIIPLIISLSDQFPRMGHTGDLPKPRKMPFHSFLNISSFQDSAISFGTCHLRKMTSPEFLTGKWMGYYSDQRDFRDAPSQAEFDPPMREIYIVAREPSEQDRTVRHVSAEVDRQSQGMDSHGHFILEGRVSTDGAVDIIKSYTTSRWAWTWTGYVTPFGIVGFWGNNRYCEGYFWIWKEEWC